VLRVIAQAAFASKYFSAAVLSPSSQRLFISYWLLASRVNDPKHLRERAAEMRASSKELKDNNTASILRLGELYDRLAGRAEVRSDGGMPPGET
jgi:hypothetical protein